jgi:hypothetical protein
MEKGEGLINLINEFSPLSLCLSENFVIACFVDVVCHTEECLDNCDNDFLDEIPTLNKNLQKRYFVAYR